MIEIFVPSNFLPEITYTFQVILTEFYGLEICVKAWEETRYYCIRDPSGKEIRISNHFFHGDPNNLICQDNLPAKVSECCLNIDGKSHNIISLYGQVSITNDEQCYLNEDIIADAFFMLTRWEESVIEEKEQHGRFDSNKAISVIHGFYSRPVVNEYAALLIALMQSCQFSISPKVHSSSIKLSHDIDTVKRWQSPASWLKASMNNITKSLKYTSSYTSSLFDRRNDPFFNFRDMLTIAQEFDLKTTYYFSTVGKINEFDAFEYDINDNDIHEAICSITDLGHEIGLHPSYYSFLDAEMIANEKQKLEYAIGREVKACRMHFLRYDISTTPNILASVGFQSDSSLLYKCGPGFRTGACMNHTMFDFRFRKSLALIQRPLHFMDTHFIHLDSQQLATLVSNIYKEVIKYGGQMHILWHNNNLWPEDKHDKMKYLFNYLLYKQI